MTALGTVDVRSGPATDAGAPSAASASLTRYVPSLDGLRALAVGVVIAYHLGYLDGGYLGVDLFFVVSGYLITTLLLTEVDRSGRVSLHLFWARRFRRLLPAVLVAVAAVMVATRVWLPSWRWPSVRADGLATLLYVANWRQIATGVPYFTGVSPFRHTWSLSLEEQFYLVWPLLVALVVVLARHRARLAVAVVGATGAVASAAWMAHLAAGSPDTDQLSRIYLGTDTRATTVLTGAVLAVLAGPLRERRRRRSTIRRWRRVAAAVAIVALVPATVMVVVAGNAELWMYRGGFVAFALLSAVLVTGCVAGVGPLAVVLALRPLRWVGRVSYALYLWSWPVQVFAVERFELAGVRLVVVVVGLSLVLAAATTAFVERPIRYGSLLRGRGWLGPAALAACAAVVVGTTLGGGAAPDFTRVSEKQAVREALHPTRRVPRAAPGQRLVMVTGDSVAFSMSYGLTKAAPTIRIEGRSIIGCGVMPPGSAYITDMRPGSNPYPDVCREQALADASGLKAKPDVVLLVTGAWEVYDQEYQGQRLRVGTDAMRDVLLEHLNDRIAAYRAAGAKVLLPLVPCFGEQPGSAGNERSDPSRRAWFNDILREIAATQPGVELIDPSTVLCHPDGTVVTGIAGLTGGVPRPDGTHYDAPGRAWIWKQFLTPAVERALGET